jgi:predicted deacylase
LTIAGKRIEPGTRDKVSIHVTSDLASEINIETHVIAGNEEGPTLLLLSMLHGEEWFSVLILREVLNRIDPMKLKGNVIAVPVANPTAFLTGTRIVADNSDEPDANRTFGSKHMWITSQITRAIEENFMKVSDFLIDFHLGGWAVAMADVGYRNENSEIAKKTREMTLAFGYPMLHVKQGTSSPRSSVGISEIKYNIPGIVAGIGGLGFGEEIEKEWLEQNVNGTLGVMKQLGMLEGKPNYCDEYLFITEYWRVHPLNGGYIETLVDMDRQFTKVEKGELLAKVYCPMTFELIEELRSPGDGILFYMCRPYMIRPGGWAFGIAKLEDNKSYWAKA